MTTQAQIISQRPKHVIYATRILWPILWLWAIPLFGFSIYTFGLPFFSSSEQLPSPTFELSGLTPTQGMIIGAFAILAFSPLLIFLNAQCIKKMKAGSASSRFGLILFLIPKIVLSVGFIYYYLSHGGLLSLIIPLITVIEMIALALIYLNPATAWFKEKKAQRVDVMHLITIQMPPQPQQLQRAIWLLWTVFSFSLVYYTYINQELMSMVMQQYQDLKLLSNFPWWMNSLTYSSYLLIAWLIYKISEGRNWARMTTLILFIIGVYAIIQQFVFNPATPLTGQIASKFYNPLTVMGMATYFMQLLNLIAMYLLFSKPSNTWYRKQKELENQLNSSIS